MKKILITIHVALIVLGLIAGHTAWAQGPAGMAVQAGDTQLFTPEELDELLAPIALYPDPLLAQILPAATFIDQIDEAARYVSQYGKSARIDGQHWDVSVKAVAHYPDVLFMMDRKYDWTVSLGQAFVTQQQDVMDAIQRLRSEAEAVGNLASTPQQQVIIEKEIIMIVPAEPEVIYVPQYDPLVVYVERPYPSYGFITFSSGFTIGAWLNRDCDWRLHRVYYHGWRGAGWISRARPYIPVRHSIYINNRYTTININHRVAQHDTARFRSDIRQDAWNRRERAGQSLPPRLEQRPGVRGSIKTTPGRPVPQAPQAPQAPLPALPTTRSAPQAPQPALPSPYPTSPAPRPATVETRQPQRPDNRDVYRGRGTQPAPSTGYGGYGSSREIKTYRERGRTSQENLRQNQQQPVRVERPTAAPRPAPVQRTEPVPRQGVTRQPAPGPATQQAPHQAPPASRGEREQKEQRQQH